MKAAYYHSHGQTVRVGQVNKPPSPNSDQLLIKVHASSINPADWKSADGEQALLLKFMWPRVYGFDFSGEVIEVGKEEGIQTNEGKAKADAEAMTTDTDTDASGDAKAETEETNEFQIGDHVFGMIKGLPQRDRGTCAEYVLVEKEICTRKPANITHAQAASLPLVGITAVKMLEACGETINTTPNAKNANTNTDATSTDATPRRVFITGGAGGVGTVAIQLAVKCGFSEIYTTASPGVKTELVKSLGATHVINYRECKYEDFLLKGGDGSASAGSAPILFDCILDCIGEAERCTDLLKPTIGKMCSILSGQTVKALRTWMSEANIAPENITFGVRAFLMSDTGGFLFECGSGCRTIRNKLEKKGCEWSHIIGTGNGRIMDMLAALASTEDLKAVIDSEFSLDDAASAIEKQKGGRCAGKVIVHCLQNETTSAAGTGSENGSDCGDNGDCDIGGKKRERGHSEEERKSKRSRSQGGLDDDE